MLARQIMTYAAAAALSCLSGAHVWALPSACGDTAVVACVDALLIEFPNGTSQKQVSFVPNDDVHLVGLAEWTAKFPNLHDLTSVEFGNLGQATPGGPVTGFGDARTQITTSDPMFFGVTTTGFTDDQFPIGQNQFLNLLRLSFSNFYSGSLSPVNLSLVAGDGKSVPFNVVNNTLVLPPPGIPEIDAASGLKAIVVILGALALAGERRRWRKAPQLA